MRQLRAAPDVTGEDEPLHEDQVGRVHVHNDGIDVKHATRGETFDLTTLQGQSAGVEDEADGSDSGTIPGKGHHHLRCSDTCLAGFGEQRHFETKAN